MPAMATKTAGGNPAVTSIETMEHLGGPTPRDLIASYAALQVATLIRFVRKKAGLNQEQLAKMISLSQSRISRLEGAAKLIPGVSALNQNSVELMPLELANSDCTVSSLVKIAEACNAEISLTLSFRAETGHDNVVFVLNPDIDLAETGKNVNRAMKNSPP